MICFKALTVSYCCLSVINKKVCDLKKAIAGYASTPGYAFFYFSIFALLIVPE
jgi:hypothetical protein